MATFKGPFKFNGPIGGIRYYQVPGDDRTYAAERGSVPKTILKKSPVFKKSRQNSYEFTPKSKCAKDVRLGLSTWSKPIVNRQLHCQLVRIMDDILHMDKVGDYGHRGIYVSRYKQLLYNADYHFINPLSEILRCPYTVVDEGDRKIVTVKISGLIPSKQIKAPALASHFQLCIGLGTVKDYVWVPYFLNYMPDKNSNSNIHRETLYPWTPVDSGLMEDITLTASLPDEFEAADDITIVRSFGIVFGRMTGEVVPLKKERGSIAFLGAV
jgi:hypothetical protein